MRIAPQKAPVTWYIFGKGIYFVDMVSKSANYCFTNWENPVGCILLCDVVLRECNPKLEADYEANKLPQKWGFFCKWNKAFSTNGCGKTAPPKEYYVLLEGPIGKGENTNIGRVEIFIIPINLFLRAIYWSRLSWIKIIDLIKFCS